jgi:subtilase family serine protease
MNRQSKNRHGDSARGSLKFSSRKFSSHPSRNILMEALDNRTLLSAAPTLWQAQPIARPVFFNQPPAQTASQQQQESKEAAVESVVPATYAGSATAYGLTPAQVEGAYGVSGISFSGVVGNGAGETIAIIDAYDDPNALSDLNAFSTHFGLPTFDAGTGSPTFAKLNQSGGTSLPGTDPDGPYSGTGGSDWEQEESLDIEWAHVIAPQANIDLFEANNAGSLFTAVATARQTSGVTVVSMSWGGSEFSGETSDDSADFTTPAGHIGAGNLPGGITFVASAGDEGAYGGANGAVGVEYPAASPNVLSVGGTALTVSGDSYVSETGWGNGTSSGASGGGGGGISSMEAQPAFQSGVVTQSTTNRTVPDVSMLASPNTGVPIYDSWDFGTATPWLPGYEGGTSLAAPMWAGLVAIADQGRNLSNLGSLNGATQTLPTLYKLPASDFHDITSGNNGYAAGPGYDLVTGIGTPVANLLVPALAGVSSSTTPAPTPVAPTVATLTASAATITAGSTFTLTAGGVSDPNAGASVTKVSFYRESNGVAGLQTTGTADTLVGAATSGSNGAWTLSLSSSGLSAGAYTFYAVATDSLGLNSTAASTVVTVAASANSATYVRTDSTTLGNWKGVYGTQGEYIAGDSLTDPSFATLTSNGYVYTWATSSTSTQNLQRDNSSGRIGSMLYAPGQLQVGVDLTDGKTHQIAFYIPDWNSLTSQYETVAAYDGTTGAELSSQTVNTGTGGKYLVFNITGNVLFTFTPTSGTYGVIGGFFLDP